MPEMNGLEAIVKLKENPKWKDIPVLFLTGYTDEKILADAKNAGALEVINKPIVASILSDSVKKYG
jgi:CheY-like chemotaxis protein